MKKRTISLLLVGLVTLVGCGTTEANSENIKTKEKNVEVSTEADKELLLDNMSTETAEDVLERLKKGQNPFAVVLSYSDSRAVTGNIFNTGLGDIFDIKLAGNVVDDLALGSIEYGVEHLGIKLLVVMGHESCGAVTDTYSNVYDHEEVDGKIANITEKIQPAVEGAKSIEEASHNNVYEVIEEIKKDGIIKELVDTGKLKIVPAYYGLDGKVEFLTA